ncbi:hypothetical protein D5W64_13345 [Salmonella enterica subsp. enterica serovar Saintpaul]|nr:hypothetical protein [Salmonella enterica subsp. enterica serovar Saintpaul]
MTVHYTLSGLEVIAQQFPKMIEEVVQFARSRGNSIPECGIYHAHLDSGHGTEIFPWIVQNNAPGIKPACTITLNTEGSGWNITLDAEDFNDDFVIPEGFARNASNGLQLHLAQSMARRWYNREMEEKVIRLCDESEFTDAFELIWEGISGGYDDYGYTVIVHDNKGKMVLKDVHYTMNSDLEKNRDTFYRYLAYAVELSLIADYNKLLTDKWSSPLLFN